MLFYIENLNFGYPWKDIHIVLHDLPIKIIFWYKQYFFISKHGLWCSLISNAVTVGTTRCCLSACMVDDVTWDDSHGTIIDGQDRAWCWAMSWAMYIANSQWGPELPSPEGRQEITSEVYMKFLKFHLLSLAKQNKLLWGHKPRSTASASPIAGTWSNRKQCPTHSVGNLLLTF